MNNKTNTFKNVNNLTGQQLANYFESKGLTIDSIYDVINIIQPIQEFWGITAPIVLAQVVVTDVIIVTLAVSTNEDSQILLMDVLEKFIEDAQNTIN